MIWEEKFAAIKSLASDACLRMRQPGNWYVAVPGVEVRLEHALRSPTVAAPTPEAAVNEMWAIYTNLPPNQYLMIDAYGDNRRSVRWDGKKWADVRKAVLV